MSYDLDLSDLRRDASTPVTRQLVDRLVELIDGGALEPGARLPSTRSLAVSAHINHLTAARVYRRLAALIVALERHLDREATWTVPAGGHHVWVTLRRPVDERALYAEALNHGSSFLPGGAVQAESSPQTRLRVGFGLVAEEDLDEGVRRLTTALRSVRRRQRVTTTTALS